MSTNDIAVRTSEQQGHAVQLKTLGDANEDRLMRWAEKAIAVRQIADQICGTSFVPAAYRNKPDEATAAILAGDELGFDPMASLRAFHSIQGVPAPAAITLRAVVQGKGHEVEIVEADSRHAVVRGRRRGHQGWQTSVWDLDRAQAMDQYKKNPNWKTMPGAMLVARATAEVCRWIAADAIMGMPYAAEEIEGDPAAAAAPTVRKLTIDDLDDDPPAQIAGDDGQQLTDEQRDQIAQLWTDLGFSGDENYEQRLTITAKILGFAGLESESVLTRVEADQVIAALAERKAKTAAGQ